MAIRRKLLILDLDNTLVFCGLKGTDVTLALGTDPPQHVLRVPVSDPFVSVSYVMFTRPHLVHFLQHVSRWYDLAIYSAAVAKYGNVIVDKICELSGVNISLRYWRDECIPIGHPHSQEFTKDILKVAREWAPRIPESELLANVILVDDKQCSLRLYPQNGILVPRWNGIPGDVLLPELLAFLERIRNVNDVRYFEAQAKPK